MDAHLGHQTRRAQDRPAVYVQLWRPETGIQPSETETSMAGNGTVKEMAGSGGPTLVESLTPSWSKSPAQRQQQRRQEQQEQQEQLNPPFLIPPTRTLSPPRLATSLPSHHDASPTPTKLPAQAPSGNRPSLLPRDTEHMPPRWASVLGFGLVVAGGLAALFIAASAVQGVTDAAEARWFELSMASSAVAIVASLLCIGTLAVSSLRCITRRAFGSALGAGMVMVILWVIPFAASVSGTSSIALYASSPIGQSLLVNAAASAVYALTVVSSQPTWFSAASVAGPSLPLPHHKHGDCPPTIEVSEVKETKKTRRGARLDWSGDEGDSALGDLPVGYGREYWARSTEAVDVV